LIDAGDEDILDIQPEELGKTERNFFEAEELSQKDNGSLLGYLQADSIETSAFENTSHLHYFWWVLTLRD